MDVREFWAVEVTVEGSGDVTGTAIETDVFQVAADGLEVTVNGSGVLSMRASPPCTGLGSVAIAEDGCIG